MKEAGNIPPTGIDSRLLKDIPKTAASKECRSLNGEVIKRLEKPERRGLFEWSTKNSEAPTATNNQGFVFVSNP